MVYRLANADYQKLVGELVDAQMFVQREEFAGRLAPHPIKSNLYGRAAAAIAGLSEELHGIEQGSVAPSPEMRRANFAVVKQEGPDV